MPSSKNAETSSQHFVINIPSDCEDDPGRRLDLAIMQAREEERTYHMPCNWVLIEDDGENVTIRKDHHASDDLTAGLSYQVDTMFFKGHQLIHLKVWKHDGTDGITWDQLQAVKNEAVGENVEMLEVYPAERDLVNEVNRRHLFTAPFVLPNLARRN